MTIADKLEAALPANDADTGPVTLPADVVRAAMLSLRWESASAEKWHQRHLEAIDRMGEAKPWKLIAITAALAFVAGAVLL